MSYKDIQSRNPVAAWEGEIIRDRESKFWERRLTGNSDNVGKVLRHYVNCSPWKYQWALGHVLQQRVYYCKGKQWSFFPLSMPWSHTGEAEVQLHSFLTSALDVCNDKAKGKAVPLQACSIPQGSSKLRFPDYTTTAQDGDKVVSLTHRPLLPPENAPGTHFC